MTVICTELIPEFAWTRFRVCCDCNEELIREIQLDLIARNSFCLWNGDGRDKWGCIVVERRNNGFAWISAFMGYRADCSIVDPLHDFLKQAGYVCCICEPRTEVVQRLLYRLGYNPTGLQREGSLPMLVRSLI